MGLFWAKYARRIFAIVSTTSIPNLAPVSPTEATVDPPSRGSRLDADHPENGVLIPRRFTTELLKRGFLGWLRGERGHCTMARVPTIAEEDAKRPNRERECLV